MPHDHDLIAKFFSLHERNRANFIQFFGVSSLSEEQIAELENSLAASLVLKEAVNSAKPH